MEEYQGDLTRPGDYETLGGRFVRAGLELLSIQELVNIITDVFLSPRREVLLSDWKYWAGEKVRKGGFWGFSKAYWTNKALLLERDRLGAGHTFPVKMPTPDSTNPILTAWVEGSNFGYFNRRGFLSSDASTDILTPRLSDKLVRVADQEGLDIMVLGQRVTSNQPIGRVCSLYFDENCINLDLRDPGKNPRYALGK